MLTRLASVASAALTMADLVTVIPGSHEISVVLHASLLADLSEGTILSVDAETNVFTLATKEGNTEYKVTELTKYTLDGKPSTMTESLKAGRTAKVAHEHKEATSVDVSTK